MNKNQYHKPCNHVQVKQMIVQMAGTIVVALMLYLVGVLAYLVH